MATHESNQGLWGIVRSADSLATIGERLGRKVFKAGISNVSQQLAHNISEVREEITFMPYEPGAKGQDKLTARVGDLKTGLEAVRRFNPRSFIKEVRRAAEEVK